MSELPARLQEIVDDFNYCEGQEKLEYLLEMAQRLEPLPEWLEGRRDAMDEVNECMSPIFMAAENKDGRLIYHFDVPPEAPTVRGFAAILQQGLNGTTPAQVLAVPSEFYLQMGLQKVLSGQRLNGIGAILAHMKTLARET
jgi:cysteine desulfuration protein SufE